MKAEELAKSPVCANAAAGELVVWAMLDFGKEAFALQVQVRKALQLLLNEEPARIGIAVLADGRRRLTVEVPSAWENRWPPK